MIVRMSHRLGLAAFAIAAAAWLPLTQAASQTPPAPGRPTLVRIPAPKQPEGAIALPVAPGATQAKTDEEQWVSFMGQPRLINVRQASLTPVLPPPGRATGAAMIVAPGGGFVQLAMDKEGWNVARWLADHGIAAFVLKYRLRPFAEARSAAGAANHATAATATGTPIATPKSSPYPLALEDAKAALRLVHARAADWGIDPDRIGMIGFSAGARLTLATALAPGVDAKPDFIAAVYGPMDRQEVPPDAPPLFAAAVADDKTSPIGDLGLIRSWLGARRPVELHLYEKGGHGFGVPGAAGTTTTALMEQLHLWLRSQGLLD